MDLALNNQPRLICHKPKQTNKLFYPISPLLFVRFLFRSFLPAILISPSNYHLFLPFVCFPFPSFIILFIFSFPSFFCFSFLPYFYISVLSFFLFFFLSIFLSFFRTSILLYIRSFFLPFFSIHLSFLPSYFHTSIYPSFLSSFFSVHLSFLLSFLHF